MIKTTYEEKIKELMNSVKSSVTEQNYTEVIRKILYLRNRYFDKMTDEQKYISLFSLSLAYKKENLLEQSLFTAKEAEKFAVECDKLCNILWILNELEIALGLDERNIIIHRYLVCCQYYKSISNSLFRSHIIYNIAKYKKNEKQMMTAYKLVLKEYQKKNWGNMFGIGLEREPAVLEMLNDFENISNTIHNEAKNYIDTLNKQNKIII